MTQCVVFYRGFKELWILWNWWVSKTALLETWFNSTQTIELLHCFMCLQIEKYKNTLNFWLCKKHTWNKLLIQNEKIHPEILFYAVCSVLKHTCSLVLYLHEWFCMFIRSFPFFKKKNFKYLTLLHVFRCPFQTMI